MMTLTARHEWNPTTLRDESGADPHLGFRAVWQGKGEGEVNVNVWGRVGGIGWGVGGKGRRRVRSRGLMRVGRVE